MALKVGDRVRHPVLHEKWGPGEILAITSDGKVTVRFALEGQKILKGVALMKLEGADAAHPLLDGRKGASAKKRRTRSFAASREAFLSLFLDGFHDPRYLEQERDYKVEAGAKLKRTLGRSVFSKLLRERKFEEIAKRAVTVTGATNLVFPNEKMSFKDGLRDAPRQELFSVSLFELLYGSGAYQPRFEKFADTLERMNANKWPVATYFPFIASPKDQMFLKPEVTKRAADACNFELNYRVDLNWRTYEHRSFDLPTPWLDSSRT